jgi:hypothetical protein
MENPEKKTVEVDWDIWDNVCYCNFVPDSIDFEIELGFFQQI